MQSPRSSEERRFGSGGSRAAQQEVASVQVLEDGLAELKHGAEQGHRRDSRQLKEWGQSERGRKRKVLE